MFNYGQQYYPQYVPQMQRLQNLEQQYSQFSQQPQQSYPQNPQSYPQLLINWHFPKRFVHINILLNDKKRQYSVKKALFPYYYDIISKKEVIVNTKKNLLLKNVKSIDK